MLVFLGSLYILGGSNLMQIVWENVEGFAPKHMHCLEWCHIRTPVHDRHASEEPCSKGVKTTLVGENQGSEDLSKYESPRL